MSFKYTLQVINDIVLEEYVNQHSCCYNTQCIHFKPTGGTKERRFSFYYLGKVYLCAHHKKNTPFWVEKQRDLFIY